MADDSSTGTTKSADQAEPHDGAQPGRRRVLSAQGAIRRARAHVQEMTGQSPGTVIGLERDDDHGWQVTVEGPQPAPTTESVQLPDEYSVHLDAEGELIFYRRADHYVRNSVVEALNRGFVLDLGLGTDIVADVDAQVLGSEPLGLQVRGALTPPQRGSASGQPEQHPGGQELEEQKPGQ